MDTIRRAAKEDGRFALEAYHFLLSGLDQAVKMTGRSEAEVPDRHVSGQELVEALRLLALDTYGPLAKEVWNSWGLKSTRDWGEIVFVLIECKLFSRQESDSLEDFERVFDFEEGLQLAWEPQLPLEEDLFGRGGHRG
jgi:uncharacterized repeat protein (TIGR04138 family)